MCMLSTLAAICAVPMLAELSPVISDKYFTAWQYDQSTLLQSTLCGDASKVVIGSVRCMEVVHRNLTLPYVSKLRLQTQAPEPCG